ncbi:calmodulin binding protein PICBP [Trifolium pratense]|uniref:calmodulin binding protein PICBP n=1 Tax=Trifolium pratense TaxID=57577 RepID=UPI001E696CEC|nr:calmodulin binding protein PICBP [Trifolium pratense]
MFDQKAEIESQDMIEADESVSSHQENRGKFESKKKMKKVRSMKLQRLSSRGRKSQHDHKFSILSSVGTVEVADASPNYMKGTSSSSSHAKDSFQIAENVITNKKLTRVTTLKVKRSLTRKLSGRTEQNRKLKSSRSIKLASVKGPKSTTMLYSDSESVHGSDGKNKSSTSDAGNKSQRVITRRLSLKPVRISSKKPSLHKATCSSTIKDSHFSDQIDIPQEGSSSLGLSAVRVCPYTYCSLHGHRHGDLPPLKRFVSMRRHQIKTQKSVKKDGRSKQIGNARKATQKTKTVQSVDGNSHFHNVKNLATDSSPFKSRDTPPSTVNEGDTSTKGKNMEPDFEVLQKSFGQEEPKTGSTASASYGVQERDQKYIKKWHLMYKHAVLSNTGKCEYKVPFVEKDKNSYSETDSDMDDEKKNVIELVQKAFDEILLPEAENLSSDDHSKSRGNETDEVLLDKCEGKIEERNATTFAESPKELQKMESKPKSWSHLKKVILLKRFVKALEKVRNINPRPRQFPSDANFEAETVLLNRQTAEERKKSEEWMLDYAIQKVISKLAPVQRQKVTLLIEAFETIRPFHDADNGPRSTVTVESQENPIQSVDASSNHSKGEINEGRDCEETEGARNDKNVTACEKNDENATMESTSAHVVKFPVFNEAILEEEVTIKTENMEPDHKVPENIFVQEEPKHGSSSSSTTGVPYGVKEGDQKYIKKWHLMYKHAVLSNTGKCKSELPFVGKDNEGREEDDITFNGGKSSCHYYSETDSDMDDEKKNVIELVQKAFDEILLPEAEDLTCDGHSKSRSYGSEEVLLEKSEGKEEEEMNTTTFTESPKESQKMENKPKSWSHLKKLILLKRFVKALDKVRNINPRRPRQLPSDANFEAEKVLLNRQSVEERKKSEEWMLDYALQKVISKLAPAQRQKVTLLIEAFETIRPFQDAEYGPRSTVVVKSQENPIQSFDASSNHSKEEIKDGRDFEVTERARNDKNMTACNENKESAAVESTSTDVVKFPVFSVGISEEEVTTKGENLEPDHKVPQKIFVQEEPKHGSSNTGVPYGGQEGDQKYIKKWHLMYKHAVLSNTGNCENEPPFVGKDNEGREEDDVAFNHSETDSDMDDEKKNVIELVQKAFDEILFPEAEDLSSDDHSESRSYGSEDVLLEKNEGKEEERNTTTFTESPKESQKMENKPKSWSYLKKVILLKRFVKALDKVRNINPRRPRQLPSDATFEAEKVFLNRQTAEERKKSEEWMLDYALQKVISKLAPAQRQRVRLLIEAFETIRPFQDAEKGPQSSLIVESQENPIQSVDASSNHRKDEVNDGRDSVYLAKSLHELCNPIKPVETISSCNEEAPTNGIVEEVPEDLVSDLNAENRSIKSESPGRYCETKNVIGDNSEQFSLKKSLILNGLVRSLKANLVVPEAPSNQLDEPTRDRKDMIEKDQLETSEAPTSAVVESETQVEKQGNKGLWFMVYKHMVSDMTENNSKTLTDVADEKESKYEGSITRENSVSDESTPVINQDMHLKDRDVELRQIEAIKMVEEAIDSILPDRQPLTDNNTIDEMMEYGNGIAVEQKEESISKEGNKPSQKLSRNWSNLKKVVLLRRFIKALEKVRKFNPREPRYLPLEADSEDEKVQLRHQDTAERKGTEEWMLDYALRQVVSKLTPARKRKVELLVEAFETVKN